MTPLGGGWYGIALPSAKHMTRGPKGRGLHEVLRATAWPRGNCRMASCLESSDRGPDPSGVLQSLHKAARIQHAMRPASVVNARTKRRRTVPARDGVIGVASNTLRRAAQLPHKRALSRGTERINAPLHARLLCTLPDLLWRAHHCARLPTRRLHGSSVRTLFRMPIVTRYGGMLQV